MLLALTPAVVVTGCGLVPPTVDCGPLDPSTCQQRLVPILRDAQRGEPARRVVSVTFTDDRGSYAVKFEDGTGSMLIVD